MEEGAKGSFGDSSRVVLSLSRGRGSQRYDTAQEMILRLLVSYLSINHLLVCEVIFRFGCAFHFLS